MRIGGGIRGESLAKPNGGGTGEQKGRGAGKKGANGNKDAIMRVRMRRDRRGSRRSRKRQGMTSATVARPAGSALAEVAFGARGEGGGEKKRGEGRESHAKKGLSVAATRAERGGSGRKRQR